MFSNVPQNFLPPEEHRPALFYPNSLFNYIYNNKYLNAAEELVDKSIQIKGWGKKVVIIDDNIGKEITYNELQTMVNKFGNVLKKLGIKEGDRVIFRFGESYYPVVVQLAIWKIGAICVPSALQEMAREIEYECNDAEAAAIICQSDALDEVKKSLSNVKVKFVVSVPGDPDDGFYSFKKLMDEASDSLEPSRTQPFDATGIFYTGGTTGHPKGCLHHHAAELAISDLNCLSRGLTDKDVLLTHTPIGHTFGNGEKILFPLRSGATVIIKERPTPAYMWELMEKYGVTMLVGAPTMFKFMLKEAGDVPQFNLNDLRALISSGEICSTDLAERWYHTTKVNICNVVGMTPMKHVFLSSQMNGNKEAPDNSVGKLFPGYEGKLIDDAGNEVDRNEVGRLIVRGPSGITYWNNIHPAMPDKQKTDVINGWSLLDDAYILDEDGWFWFQSRLDNMIVTAGRQIAGPEVEDVVGKYQAVSSVAVIASPDEDRGNVVKAFIELKEGFSPSENLKKEIQDFAKKNMAMYKYPRKIEFIDKLPTDHVGKIQRKVLRDKEMNKSIK